MHSTLLCKRMHKGLYNWELVRTQFKTLKLNCRGSYTCHLLRLGGSPKLDSLFFIKRACTVAPQVEKARPRPIAKALLARVPRIGAHKASFPRPITCGAGFSLWRCRVERAVRSHSLRAWAIGRAQMAIPSKECTLLHTITTVPPRCGQARQHLASTS